MFFSMAEFARNKSNTFSTLFSFISPSCFLFPIRNLTTANASTMAIDRTRNEPRTGCWLFHIFLFSFFFDVVGVVVLVGTILMLAGKLVTCNQTPNYWKYVRCSFFVSTSFRPCGTILMHYRCVSGRRMNKINDMGIRLEWLVEMYRHSTRRPLSPIHNLIHCVESLCVLCVFVCDGMRCAHSMDYCVSNFLVAVYHNFRKMTVTWHNHD